VRRTVRKTDRYRQLQDGSWTRAAHSDDSTRSPASFEVQVQESPNEPPKLIAVDPKSGASVVLLDRTRSCADSNWVRRRDIRGRM